MITDWSDAYENGKYIPDGETYRDMWQASAAEFRASLPDARKNPGISYGPHSREVYDLFLPEGTPRGVVVFVHGGYWIGLDQRYWSHLAAGPLAHGWAVAMPAYPLCPEVTIAQITKSVARAVAHIADRIDGPIRLAGHSAGGHLVARMVCDDIDLPAISRIERVVGISGVYDLRPLTRTGMNDTLGLTISSASAESPALKMPREGIDVVCWVGADERPEFRRQSALLANIWAGCFINVRTIEVQDRHHFSVIGDLGAAQSDLTRMLVDPHQGG